MTLYIISNSSLH